MSVATILLVEDDRHIAAHWRQAMEESGYRVIHETTAVGAIDALEDLTIDLVVTDIVLESPDVQLDDAGGLKVISYIALNVDPQPKIIATSGLNSNSSFVDLNFKKMSSVRALRKPVKVEVLLSAIGELLSEKSDRDALMGQSPEVEAILADQARTETKL
jgi:CheY-like chemotaxis protein